MFDKNFSAEEFILRKKLRPITINDEAVTIGHVYMIKNNSVLGFNSHLEYRSFDIRFQHKEPKLTSIFEVYNFNQNDLILDKDIITGMDGKSNNTFDIKYDFIRTLTQNGFKIYTR